MSTALTPANGTAITATGNEGSGLDARPDARPDVPPDVPPEGRPLLAENERRTGEQVAVDNIEANTETSDRPDRLQASRRTKIFWLRKTTLFALSTLFTVLWIALVVLWHFDRSSDGFRLTVTSNHLAWTYGPTAILVVVVSLWRQVDYYCKSTQPWKAMKGEFRSAKTTLLLDYIWPLQVNSLLLAIRNRHILVVCSIIGFALLKITTLVSVGLLVTSELPVTRILAANLQSSFDGTKFWATPVESTNIDRGARDYALLGYTNLVYDGYTFVSPVPAFTNLSDSFALSYFGGLKDKSLRSPFIVDGIAVRPFSVPVEDGIITSTANVDVFVPDVECESAKIGDVPAFNDTLERMPYQIIESPSCPSYEGNEEERSNLTSGVFTYFSGCMSRTYCPDSYPMYASWRVNCSVPQGERRENLTSTTPWDFRIVAAVMDVHVTRRTYVDRYSNETSFIPKNSVKNATAVVCKVGYGIQKADVSVTQGVLSNLVLNKKPSKRKQLDDLTDQQLTEILWTTISDPKQSSSDLDTQYAPHAYNHSYPIKLMDDYIAATSGPDVKFDEQNMKESLSTILSGLASSFMIDLYTAPTNATIDAVGTFSEQRLRVKVAPLITMIVMLVILSLVSLLIGLIGDSTDPGHHDEWTGHARVLASSKGLRSLLAPLSHVPTKTMQRELQSFRFKMDHDRAFVIEGPNSRNKQASEVHDRGKKWTPLAARWYMLSLAFLLPVIAIIVVEILWQVSIKHDGVVSVSDADSVKAYAIRYASTLTALLIATMFNNLDFAVAALAPFSALLSPRTTLKKVPRLYLLGSLPPVALFHALINGQFGAVLSMIATIIGSVLTIVTSGFWYQAISLQDQAVSITRGSFWDVDWDAAAGDAGAGIRFNNVQHGAVAPSSNVWTDFVLPDLSKPAQREAVSSTRGSPLDVNANNFTFVIPALRPQMECEALDRSGLRYVADDPGRSSFGMSATIRLPDECGPAASPNRTLKTTSHYLLPSAYERTHDIAWYGSFSDLATGDYYWDRPSNVTPAIINEPTDLTLSHDGCPTMSLTIGFTNMPFKPDEEDLADTAVFLLCYQRIEQVPLAVTFVGDPAGLRLSTEHPPVPHEAEAINLTRPLSKSPYFDYNITHSIFDNIKTFDTNLPIRVDELLNNVIVGPNGTGIDDIRPPAGTKKLIQAVERIFTVYMLEAIDLNMRRRTTTSEEDRPTDQPALLNGTMTSSHLRFKVDKASKIALEVMLAVMLVLEVGALALLQLKGVLPRNPCSLASSMALVAGSRLCDNSVAADEGSSNDERTVKNSIDIITLSNERVSLGWWNRRVPNIADPDPAAEDRQAEDVGEEGAAIMTERKRDGETWFGIDLGTADVLGHNMSQRRWLGMRKRRPRDAGAED